MRLPLASLPEGGRAEVEYAGEPTEVVRTEAGVVARSLLCSHFGCRVEWRPGGAALPLPLPRGPLRRGGEARRRPPNRPLRRVRAEVVGADVVIGEP